MKECFIDRLIKRAEGEKAKDFQIICDNCWEIRRNEVILYERKTFPNTEITKRRKKPVCPRTENLGGN